MIQRQEIERGAAVGVDSGATLTKLAIRCADGTNRTESLPGAATDRVVERLLELQPSSLGLTGCGASALQALLSSASPAPDAPRFSEFEAWGRGASMLLDRTDFDADPPYLLVSLGTGTSVMRVDGKTVARVGGTALGGGTVLGLGVALTGCESFAQLCEWAERGESAKVDLLVSDIYAPGEIALPGETTASAFGSLARWLSEGRGYALAPAREDLAAAVMNLVAENVALVVAGITAITHTQRWVLAGGTLHENPVLQHILLRVAGNFGVEAAVLDGGGHAGAVGALALAVEGRTD